MIASIVETSEACGTLNGRDRRARQKLLETCWNPDIATGCPWGVNKTFVTQFPQVSERHNKVS